MPIKLLNTPHKVLTKEDLKEIWDNCKDVIDYMRTIQKINPEFPTETILQSFHYFDKEFE